MPTMGTKGWQTMDTRLPDSGRRALLLPAGTAARTLGLIAMLAWLGSSAQAQQDWVFDDFENSSLRSGTGWTWTTFNKGDTERETLEVGVEHHAGGGVKLVARGTLPDDGTGFSHGGLMCAPGDGEDPGPRSIDLSSFAALGFRASSNQADYYAVRIEQESTGYNSTNIALPLTSQMREFIIPLDAFKTGVSDTTALVFTRLVDSPGAVFHIELDDIVLRTEIPADEGMRRLRDLAEWSASPQIGWQNATFRNLPLLVYFSSDFATPCRVFEEHLVESAGFPEAARGFVLARVDVNDYQALARQCGVIRVPAFVVFEPSTGLSSRVYAGTDTAALVDAMRGYLGQRANTPAGPSATNPSEQYDIVLIDDFSDRSNINRVGGQWGAFSAGDHGDITWRFVDLDGGNLALEASGRYPVTAGGQTYGGIYCDLAPGRGVSRNLAAYRWLSFICRSSASSVLQVHLEDGNGQRSAAQVFHVSPAASRITVPIANFGPVAGRAVTIVWTEPSAMPGARFEIVLDDVMIIR